MDDDSCEWVDIAADTEVTPQRPFVARLGRTQLAIFRDQSGRLYAIDNRCPHEGYPLAQGKLQGCVLTCAWHNFKFDLTDGQCLKGDEPVSTYPLQIRQGRIWVDVQSPVDDTAIARGLERLHDAVYEGRLGQIARELVRLLEHGVQPERLAMEAVRFDAERGQWGLSHAMAVAVDLRAELPRYRGSNAAAPLMQLFDIVVENQIRRPLRPRAEPIDPGDDPVAAGQRLRQLVQDEQPHDAEALVRGGLAKGWRRAQLEPWFFALCCDHFLSFGHPLIYQTKIFDLLDHGGWEYAPSLLSGHLWGIVHATREDTLPHWRPFITRLEASISALPSWHHRCATQGTVAELPPKLRLDWWNAWVTGHRDQGFDAVRDALDRGYAPSTIADLIAAAAAERLLRFDGHHSLDPTIQEGWLDVTHPMTFAAAVHHAVSRYDEPHSLRLLFYAARWVNHARPLDASHPLSWSPSTATIDSPQPIVDAIAARDPKAALCVTEQYLKQHGPDDGLRQAIFELPFKDLYTRSILVAHVIKVGRVAFELADRLVHTPWTYRPILALVRFAASPQRERLIGQVVHEAQRLVVDAKVPRSLT